MPNSRVLRAIDARIPRVLRVALPYGRAPFFYYVVHFAVIHLLAVATCLAIYGSAHWMFESSTLDAYPYTRPPGWGFPLPVVYGVWILVVLLMYPASRWFADLKARRGGIVRFL